MGERVTRAHFIITTDNKPALATLEKTTQGVRVTLESERFVCSLPLTAFIAVRLASKLERNVKA